MIEFKTLRGVKVSLSDLKISGKTGKKVTSVVERLLTHLGENVKIFLFGGAVRNLIFSYLGHKVKDDTDIDILVEIDKPFHDIFNLLGKEEEFQPILVVSEDTIRIYQEGVDNPIDIKFTYLVQDTPFDFTINAVLVPLLPLLEGGKSPIFVASIEDFERRTLHHMSPFNAYPFHLLRGVRLVSTLNLKFHSETLNAYVKSAKFVNTVSPSLAHREFSKAIVAGFEKAIWALYTTTLVPHFFPPLLKFARNHKDEFINSSEVAYNLIKQFNPEGGSKDVRKLLGRKVVTHNLAPQRPIIYSYAVAAMLLPLDYPTILRVLIDKNFYPAERGLILQCVGAVKEDNSQLQRLPLVYPFYLAFQHAKG